MPRYKIKPLTEEQYKEAPEAVRRFMIAATEKIPIPELEIAKTIRDHPQYFELAKPKSHSQKVKRMLNLKQQTERLKLDTIYSLPNKNHMNFDEANEALKQGKKVRLPEWRGYWFMNEEGYVRALTKDGEIVDASANVHYKRIGWEIADGLDFGWALSAIKAGKPVTREGWDGKVMFVFMRPSDSLTADFVINKVKSLPKCVKDFYFSQFSFSEGESKRGNGPAQSEVHFNPYLCMKAADGTIVNGWLASQTDLFAEDWQLFRS
ncbi:hypothetical protein DN752_17935 [Echinicola strongylocentroti]|uniref:Thoeris anti-defense 2-like domain-containing protein n=1 Tax=Echinicola strongylocentroti TaxID=1795355 RepID=A0A2Z4IL76_9BACT|nr:DUF2829 domain-containing protein [Echinicola strongylocentroti]AWW31861.1 hypothetical protein DN752_17935 [Echinicola strongylocentroti]